MGITREIRKRIEGHKRMIAAHDAKVRAEQAKPYPNEARIELWHKQIANAQAQIEKLERRLERRRG